MMKAVGWEYIPRRQRDLGQDVPDLPIEDIFSIAGPAEPL